MMGWDTERKGHYCDRCDAAIWLDIRQERFRGKKGEGSKAGDPYISVNHNAFFEEGKGFGSSFMYCFDCEPVVIAVLAALNKGGKT